MDGMHWRSLIEEIGRTRGGHPYATVINNINITVHIVQNLQSQGAMGPLGPCEAPPLMGWVGGGVHAHATLEGSSLSSLAWWQRD